jgi:hypothetical protein
MPGDKRFTLRMDQGVFDAVERLAKKNKRTTASQIEYILERYLREIDDDWAAEVYAEEGSRNNG